MRFHIQIMRGLEPRKQLAQPARRFRSKVAHWQSPSFSMTTTKRIGMQCQISTKPVRYSTPTSSRNQGVSSYSDTLKGTGPANRASLDNIALAVIFANRRESLAETRRRLDRREAAALYIPKTTRPRANNAAGDDRGRPRSRKTRHVVNLRAAEDSKIECGVGKAWACGITRCSGCGVRLQFMAR